LHGKPLAKKVGDIHVDCACGAVFLARHAIPAFVKLHEGFVFHEINGQDIQRANIDTDGATLIGDAFVFIHDNGSLGAGEGDRHDVSKG
jgi:hypothetical protein